MESLVSYITEEKSIKVALKDFFKWYTGEDLLKKRDMDDFICYLADGISNDNLAKIFKVNRPHSMDELEKLLNKLADIIVSHENDTIDLSYKALYPNNNTDLLYMFAIKDDKYGVINFDFPAHGKFQK